MTATAVASSKGLKVSGQRRDLFEGLQIVSKAVATRTTLPILGHVLINHDGDTGEVRLTATDLEMWIEHTLPRSQESIIAISAGGATTAPARNFADLLAALPEAAVELTSEGGEGVGFTTHVRCNRANFKLLALNPDDFPVLPSVVANTRLVIEKSVLRDALRQVLFAVSTDESRIVLTGVLVVYKDGTLKCVATDTHRLAVREIRMVSGSEGDAQAVVPSRAMSELLRVMGNSDDGTVTLMLSDNQIQFRTDDEKTGSGTTLISRLIEGQFPNYERVVPQNFDSQITVERELFAAALKRASIFAREQGSANRVVIRSTEDADGTDRLLISAISDTLGTALEEVEIARGGATDPVEIAFNVKYLMDVLNAIEADGVHLELTAPLRPGVVRPTEGSDYFCVLMPMQVV
jgi:DNA polymerase III subunit beta